MVYEDFIWWDVRGQYTSPVASAIVYKEGDYAVAKVWNEQWGRWSRIAKSTDHASVIQSAINTINAQGGGIIFLRKGTYTLSTRIQLKSNIIIIGEGFQTKLVASDYLGSYGMFSNLDFAIENVKISNLYIDGGGHSGQIGVTAFGGSDVTKKNILIHNVKFTNLNNAIYFVYASNFKIELCDFENCTQAVRILGGTDFVISRNYIHDCSNNHLTGAIYLTTNCQRGIIENNILENLDRPEDMTNGILISEPSAEACKYIVVKGNILNNIGANSTDVSAISVANGQRCLVIGNTIINIPHAGIDTGTDGEHIIIANNLLYNCGYVSAMWVRSGSLVIGNVFIDCGHGYSESCAIKIANSSHAIVMGNRIYDTRTGAERLAYGIRESGDSDYNTIVHNDIENVQTQAIEVLGANTIVKYNKGYPTENSGTATIAAGNTSVTVNHGLASTPSKVLVTPLGDPGDRYYVTNITGTSFDIVIATAPSSDVPFAWYAEV